MDEAAEPAASPAATAAAAAQAELRRRIVEIMKDETMSEADKSRARQALLSGGAAPKPASAADKGKGKAGGTPGTRETAGEAGNFSPLCFPPIHKSLVPPPLP